MEAGAAVLNESVIYLPQVGSTNAWAKENIAQFGPVGAVYTTDQTAGRGRLGRGWVDAPGKGLYYTAVIKTDLAQPSTLPLFASLAVCDALKQRYGIDCQIKWPNDLLLNGKKIVGILCEVAPDGHSRYGRPAPRHQPAFAGRQRGPGHRPRMAGPVYDRFRF